MVQLSLVVFFLLLRDAVITVISGLIEMNLDPEPLVMLLNIDLLLLEPFQVLQTSDPSLERRLAPIVEDT